MGDPIIYTAYIFFRDSLLWGRLRRFSLSNPVLLMLNIVIKDTFFVLSNDVPVECSRGVMVKTLDCEIVVSKFELPSRYYVYFRTNNKCMKPLASKL